MIQIQYVKEQPTKESCNSSNHHELCPFQIDIDQQTITIDEKWWHNELMSSTRQTLIEYFKTKGIQFNLSPTVRNSSTHTTRITLNKNEIFWELYLTFLHQFDAQHWINNLFNRNDFRIIKLTKGLITYLQEKALLFNCGRNLKISDLLGDIETNSCWKSCCESLDVFGDCFVKLSQTSGKHDREVTPISSPGQLLKYLINSKTLLKCYQKFLDSQNDGIQVDIYLIVKPWDKKINDTNEFRVFYFNHKITAISQQKWYSKVHLNFSVHQMVKSLLTKIQSLSQLPYTCCIFDVYYDLDKNETNFIEINPWGMWNAAGSSLFHWLKDESILYSSSDETVVRLFIE